MRYNLTQTSANLLGVNGEAWQWHNQYELQRRQGIRSQGSAPGENANLAWGLEKEGTVDNDEPAVAELSAAVIKERLLTAARGSQGYTNTQ